MTRAARTTETKASGPEVYHLAGRQEWNERAGSTLKQRDSWRAVALGSMAITAVAVMGLVGVAGQNKLVPYVVEVDKLGAVLPVSPAQKASPADQRIVRSQIAEWITEVRSVYVDAGAERHMVEKAYAQLNQNSPGFQFVNEYMKSNDPFKRAQDSTVDVSVHSVMPISEKSWRVEWTETERTRQGESAKTRNMQAIITVAINPPTTEAAILVNPMGVYIDSVSWQERL